MGVSLRALLLYSFLCFWTKESRPETTFVQRGGNVLLQLKEPLTLKEGHDFFWKVRGNLNILKMSAEKKIAHYHLKDRVEFDSDNLSLLIKNLTFADSQLYTAVVTEADDTIITNYTIEVQDTVSPVVLNASSVSPGEDSCNVTVTCIAASSVVSSTFICINQTCQQEGGALSENTLSSSTLHLSLLNGSIIACNHSNQVSWTNEMKEVQHFCHRKVRISGLQPYKVVLIVVPCVLTILFCIPVIGVMVYRKKRASGSRKIMSSINTEYESPQEICATRTPIRNDAEDQVASPFSIYSLAGTPNPPDVLPSNPNRDEAETVYAQVKKPNRVTEIEMNHQNG